MILTETTLLLLTGLYLRPPNPLFAEPISGRSTNSVDLTAVNSFPALSVTRAILNRRPYYRSAAHSRLGNKPKVLAKRELFPPRSRSASPETDAGGRQSQRRCLLCSCGSSVRQVAGPSQTDPQRRRMLCTLEFLFIYFYNFFLKPTSNGKQAGLGALQRKALP